MTKHRQWHFGLEWLLATLGGLALGYLLIEILIYPFSFFEYYETDFVTRPLVSAIGSTWGDNAKNAFVDFSVSFSHLRFLVLSSAATGISIGLTQWLVLRRRNFQHKSWIFASMGGWILGWVISQNASWPIASVLIDSKGSNWEYHIILGYTLFGAFFGALMGMCQWLVLRRHVHQASLWILANILFWAVAAFIVETIVETTFWKIMGGPVGFFHDSRYLLEGIIADGCNGVLVGASTGVVLFRLLQRPLRRA